MDPDMILFASRYAELAVESAVFDCAKAVFEAEIAVFTWFWTLVAPTNMVDELTFCELLLESLTFIAILHLNKSHWVRHKSGLQLLWYFFRIGL